MISEWVLFSIFSCRKKLKKFLCLSIPPFFFSLSLLMERWNDGNHSVGYRRSSGSPPSSSCSSPRAATDPSEYFFVFFLWKLKNSCLVSILILFFFPKKPFSLNHSPLSPPHYSNPMRSTCRSRSEWVLFIVKEKSSLSSAAGKHPVYRLNELAQRNDISTPKFFFMIFFSSLKK